jgi:hypothetical protein
MVQSGASASMQAARMVQGGRGAEHDQFPATAYVAAITPLARKRAVPQLRHGCHVSFVSVLVCWYGSFASGPIYSAALVACGTPARMNRQNREGRSVEEPD